MFTTLFCLYWDFVWDWGLFRDDKPEHWALRKHNKYPPKFYYTCMIFNTIFRFWWVIGTIDIHYSKTSITSQYLEIMFFVGMMTEAFRRTFWALIRVENEQFNNYEKYRDVL
jgi:xenotropic and polytropic retrovirus receptor 1